MNPAILKIVHDRIKKKGRRRSKKSFWGKLLLYTVLPLLAGGAIPFVVGRLLVNAPRAVAQGVSAIIKALTGKKHDAISAASGMALSAIVGAPVLSLGLAGWILLKSLIKKRR